jgi:hypothetical protein
MFNRLFGRSTKPARRPQTARLGLDQLGDRVVPAVGIDLNPTTGVLAITGDYQNNDVLVYQPALEFSTIAVSSSSNGIPHPTQRFSLSAVNSISFTGGDGNDTLRTMPLFFNGNPRFSKIDGGAGNDVLYGLNGDDVFFGSPGNDTYYGRLGSDVLHRNGHHGYFSDGNESDATTGLVTGTLTYGDLTATGHGLFARYNPMTPNHLDLYGPSGAGFRVHSSKGWVADTSVPGFTSYSPALNSSVAIETGRTEAGALTKIVMPALMFDDLQIKWSAAGANAGKVTSNLSFNLTDQLDGLAGGLVSKVGGNLGLPDVAAGVGLGRTISSTPAFLTLNLPLAPAVPYLFAGVSSGDLAANALGSLGASAPAVSSLAGGFAFDPTDIGGMAKFQVDDYAIGFGWSTNGEIPYVMQAPLETLAAPQLAGHLYLSAAGSVPIMGFQVGLDGDVVIDLDALNNGLTTVGSSAVRGAATGGFESFIEGIFDEVAIGLNGTVSVSMPLSSGGLSVSLEAEGSAYWMPGTGPRPGTMAFRLQSVDPFEDTPFESMFGGIDASAEGYVKTNGSFLMKWDTSVETSFGLGDLSVGYSYGYSFTVQGSLSSSAAITLTAEFWATASAGDMDTLGFDLEFRGSLMLGVDASGVSVGGEAELSGEACIGGYNWGVDLGVSFDNDGFEVDLSGSLLDFSVNW